MSQISNMSIMDPSSLLLEPDKEQLNLQNFNTYSTNYKTTTISDLSFSTTSIQQSIEKSSRPIVFDKMENLVREMQDSETGVPVRSQKLFLTQIPAAFMGYDLIEWLMERLNIEESEALNMANLLCQYGYFFPITDSKVLVVKDDSSLYRFQIPYFFGQNKPPDNIDYAIYLTKRTLRNKQPLDDYEIDAFNSLHKNLKGKWDFITMQADEQAKLAKEKKKLDKIVSDSQERAFWRIYRPPPGFSTPLELCPIPSRDRCGKLLQRKRTSDDCQREVDILKFAISRNRVKVSQACESLCVFFEIFNDYDAFIASPLPSNPWITEDVTYWQINSPLIEYPNEKRVKRWAINFEELIKDNTGLQEFTHYLKKEYSHENIRFWMAVRDLRRSAYSQINIKVKAINDEFLAPGEINIDGKTMEMVYQELKNPSRFCFDSAADHVYTLLLKKDCYPRFIRSEHYKNLLLSGLQPINKKRFFGFGAKKKNSNTNQPNMNLLLQISGQNAVSNTLSRRRGSDRSLSGSAHELAMSAVKDMAKVSHSHSQSNLSDIRDAPQMFNVDVSLATSNDYPWDSSEANKKKVQEKVSVCPWEIEENSTIKEGSLNESESSSSGLSDISDKMRRFCLRQKTLDDTFHTKLAPDTTEQRRSSISTTQRFCSEKPLLQRPVSLNSNLSCNTVPKKSLELSCMQIPIHMKKTVSFEETSPETLHTNMLKQQTANENLNFKPNILLSFQNTDSNAELQETLDNVIDFQEAAQDIQTQNTPLIHIIFEPSDVYIGENNVDAEYSNKLSRQSFSSEKNYEALNLLFDTTNMENEQNVDFETIITTETVISGYVAPAPTPAPQSSAAPLAVNESVELDDYEYDSYNIKENEKIKDLTVNTNEHEHNKKKKKKNKKDKEKILESTTTEDFENPQSTNPVCPWDDDETVSTSTGVSFVKTYSTLGYL